MIHRILIAILIVTSTAVAQQQRAAAPKQEAESATPTDAAIAGGLPQFCFEIRMISAPDDLTRGLREMGGAHVFSAKKQQPFEDWQPLAPAEPVRFQKAETRTEQGAEFAMIELSEVQVRQFIQTAQDNVRSNILFAPKVTVFEGQIGTITDQAKVAYLSRELRSPELKTCEATEGMQIHVRAASLTDGRIQADTEIQLRGLSDKAQIPRSDDGVLTRSPKQTVSTMAVSGILSGEVLHIAVIPPETDVPAEKPASRIQRVSRVIGLGKPDAPPPTQFVWIVSVRRVAD